MINVKPPRDSSEIMEEIVVELNHMVKVPLMDLGVRSQQTEISISAEHIKQCLSELCDTEIYLLERLKHSETERFLHETTKDNRGMHS